MKNFLSTKITSRQKINPDFKEVVKEVRAVLLELQKILDEEDKKASDFVSLTQKYYPQIEDVVTRLLKETDRIASKFSDEEHLLHKDFLRDQLGAFFWAAPLHERALKKPLGYAGDYRMMEMLYDDDPFQGPTSYFKMINAASCRCISGQFCKARIPYFLEKLDMLGREAIERRGIFRVMDLACGPSREILEFIRTNAISHRTEIHLVDQDQEAIRYSQGNIEEVKRETGSPVQTLFYPNSLKDLLVSNSFPLFDFIYSGGLFDYFDDMTFETAVAMLYGLLGEKGVLVIGNISPEDYSKTVKWYLDDWPLIYRTREELLKFAPNTPNPREVVIEAEETGVNLFLVIRK